MGENEPKWEELPKRARMPVARSKTISAMLGRRSDKACAGLILGRKKDPCEVRLIQRLGESDEDFAKRTLCAGCADVRARQVEEVKFENKRAEHE